jgi:hypothetical protein
MINLNVLTFWRNRTAAIEQRAVKAEAEAARSRRRLAEAEAAAAEADRVGAKLADDHQQALAELAVLRAEAANAARDLQGITTQLPQPRDGQS